MTCERGKYWLSGHSADHLRSGLRFESRPAILSPTDHHEVPPMLLDWIQWWYLLCTTYQHKFLGISHWCCWSPVSLKRQEFLGSNPDFFGIFRPEKAQNPTLHNSLSRHRHTQESPTRPIQAQTHPRHNDPNTNPKAPTQPRHTHFPRPTDAEIVSGMAL